MANTYSQIYIHVVFSVKYRQPLISKTWKDDLFKYITGIITHKNQLLIAINGVEDHVHILISIKPDCILSDLVRDIKANSSRWINDKKLLNQVFRWQNGFGAFSIGRSDVDYLIKYITHQESHHSKKSFEQEYLNLLEENEIDFNMEYVIDPLDKKHDAPTEL